MSRTRHLKYGANLPHRQTSPTRLTPGNHNFYTWPRRVLAEGNAWAGTISAIGGNSRRRGDRDRAETKVTGRRLDRRRRNREVVEENLVSSEQDHLSVRERVAVDMILTRHPEIDDDQLVALVPSRKRRAYLIEVVDRILEEEGG